MYKTFYNLRRNPFDITPDPSFLFPTKRHNDALASLYYGVQRHKGFVVMTGEVGTGKTLLVRCLLELLNRQQIAYAYVFNSRLAPSDFLRYIAGDFRLATVGKSIGDVLLDLSNYLIARHQKSLRTVLVVDEAHHLSPEVLEEIRLLTNLETAQQKLLQILLVGQPELDQKLDSFELRQLKQRIAFRSHLDALSMAETAGYIVRRLHLAGANSRSGLIFSPEAIAVIYEYSKGTPRLINTICDNALINGYAQQAQVITADIITEIAKELRLGIVTKPTELRNEQGSLSDAVKTLLQFHDYLQSVRIREQTTNMTSSVGASRDE